MEPVSLSDAQEQDKRQWPQIEDRKVHWMYSNEKTLISVRVIKHQNIPQTGCGGFLFKVLKTWLNKTLTNCSSWPFINWTRWPSEVLYNISSTLILLNFHYSFNLRLSFRACVLSFKPEGILDCDHCSGNVSYIIENFWYLPTQEELMENRRKINLEERYPADVIKSRSRSGNKQTI